MRRRILLPLGSILPVLTILLTGFRDGKPVREYYQLTIYHFTTAEQGKTINNYLQNALLPALHRFSINKVGVFEAIANDTSASKSLYVLFPVKSLEQVVSLNEKLNEDKDFQQAGAGYINAVYTDPPYSRMETILLRAFPLAPQMQVPGLKASKKERIYELRSYESATERIFKNKVQMFNDGDEIGLFKRLNFNAVFYSEVIAGAKMPNLMYMTSFENLADHDAHWKSFSSDTQWKRLSTMAEYQHNVAHVDITLLRPADYSDF
jgi:hypothetical protein